jgi:RNA polymerase sigma factor (sigma-70 family)
MTTPVVPDNATDIELWQQVVSGSTTAFEALVRRFQSLVCAVAYNACGDLAMSEDIAQETFWQTWQDRRSLRDPVRLRAWLCGIARNLGNNARRRAARRPDAASTCTDVSDVAADGPGPVEEVVSREEESLVWQSLEQVPDTYREALILYYREQESIAGVAIALGLSEDAVKQRLSRGRGMLRDKMLEVVEGALRRSRPGRRFTVAVMAGLTTLSAGAKTALAGTGTAAGVGLTAAGAGAVGGLLGSLVGLAGGWFGVWLPAQLAPSKREREYMQRVRRRMLLAVVLITAVLVLVILAGVIGPWRYLAALCGALGAFVYILVECLVMVRGIQRMRNESSAADAPNDAPLRVAVAAVARRYRGRVYRSRATFLGRPLVDINVSDPVLPEMASSVAASERAHQVARGWIAIGDEAHGALLAVGGKAYGFVAIGGLAVGVFSVGGMAVGLLAIGGLALGGLALGGLGMGLLAFGGAAIGWQACGGLAIGWDVACGGGAMAWHAAYGGGAFAHHFAVGGAAFAEHANDAAARALLLDHPLRQLLEWWAANAAWLGVGIAVVSVLVPCLFLRAMYYKDPRA